MSKNWLIPINADKPALEKADKLYVSVPGELLCSLTIALPLLPNKNREQAIGYALEDKLASPLDDMKFFAHQDKKGTTTVLWCLHTQWKDWLKQTEKFGDHEPEAILPDYLYLPLETNAWTIRTNQNRTLLRTDSLNGLAIENSLFIELLSLQLDRASNLPAVLIYEGTELWEPLNKLSGQYGFDLIQKKLPSFAAPTDLKLSLLPKRKFHRASIKGPWKIATILALGWIALLMTGFIWQHIALNHAIVQNQKKITALYHRIDPTHDIPADLINALQNFQRSLKNSLHPDPLIQRLMSIHQIMVNYPEIKLEAFDMSGKKLEIQVSTLSMKTIGAFIAKLKQHKWSVKTRVSPWMASSTENGENKKIRITLLIEELT